MPENWWQRGAAGTEAWQEEGRFLQFLAGVYGSWPLAMGYRGIYSFQLQNSPLYQWWIKEGKPTDASKYKRERAASEPAREFWELSEEEWAEKLQDPSFRPQQAPEGYQWDWRPGFTEFGQPTQPHWTLSPTTPEAEPVDPMMQRLMGLDIEKFEWQKQQAQEQMDWARQQAETQLQRERMGLQAEQANVEHMRLANLMRGGQDLAVQQALADEWENMRSQIATQLQASPRDWISHFRAVNITNPYSPQQETPQVRLENLQEELKQARAAEKIADDIEKRYPSGEVPANVREMIDASHRRVAHIEETYLDLQSQINTGKDFAEMGYTQDEAFQAIRAEYGRAPTEAEMEGWWAGGRPVEGGGRDYGKPSEPASPTMPMIPDWLQQVSGVTGRVPEQRTAITRPSAQQWQRLMPEQQQMYAGLVDWAGQDTYLSKLTQMQQQIPQSLTLGRKWTPARQV